MGLRRCDKCDEMVDEAKAFCPGCGNSFVDEEKRQEASNFDKVDRTVQFGQTMYNQMLEDMGLNIGAIATPIEKRAEVIEPVRAERIPEPVSEKIQRELPPKTEKKAAGHAASNTKWYVLAGVAAII